MSLIVETHNLTKRYGRITAVRNMNLAVEEGEIYGFLGPNGSGKTTTILMLLGLTEPTIGRALVCGYNPLEEPLRVKRLVGYLPENVGFYNDLTAKENLRYTAALNGIPRKERESRIDDLLEQTGLMEAADRPVGQYSRGMRQRLGIADVLVKDPTVVFLDDPTIGLDPEGIQDLLNMVVAMSRQRHITVFLSSHLLYQVQRICDRVGIMFRGRLVAQGTIDDLAEVAKQGKSSVEVQVAGHTGDIVAALEKVPSAEDVRATGDRITLLCDPDARGEIARAVIESGGQVLQLSAAETDLEEVYMRYFQRAEEARAS